MAEIIYQDNHLLSADPSTKESGVRMTKSARGGKMRQHVLTNSARPPFSQKQDSFKIGFSTLLQTKNYSYIKELEVKRDESY